MTLCGSYPSLVDVSLHEACDCGSRRTEQDEGQSDLAADEEIERALPATAAGVPGSALDDLRDVWPRQGAELVRDRRADR